MKTPWIFVTLLALAMTLAGQPACCLAIDFNRDIQPILSENCYYCHGNDANHRMADLRLDQRDAAINGGAIEPGDPESSMLVDRITTTDADELMPPPHSKKQLTPEQIKLLTQWIAEGAQYQPHWAFVPIAHHSLDNTIADHPIDHFVQSKLSEQDLKPSPLAEPQTLIRRLSLDLTGIPPTPQQVEAFVAAYAAQPEAAYQELVDRLLSSPHYGERWGRWWLDQARYADSNGYSIDSPRQIWKYRDWVIQALNADMPFDQFTIEQLAGDLLPNATQSQVVATGFHRNTQINQEGGIDREQFRIDSVFDRVATTGSVWLGLTVGCAQCHDHKFDPIEQREYYKLFAFFNNQDEPTIKVYPPELDVTKLTAEFKELEQKMSEAIKTHATTLATWEKSLSEEATKKLPAAVRDGLKVESEKRNLGQNRVVATAALPPEDPFHSWNNRYEELDKVLNKADTTLVLKELAKPRKTTVFINGDFTRPSEEVQPGTLSILHPFEPAQTYGTRLDLAYWIMSRDNPLTARVSMNRVWQQYFGRGIVETENDFGLQGSAPSHPELLDWLAGEFIERGWSMKEMHRVIVSSHTYQQSSNNLPELNEQDPGNYLLARQTRLRLDAEIIRDVALSASGLLSPTVGGPSVYPPIPEGVMNVGQAKHRWDVSQGSDRYRRGMYTFIHRATPPPALSVFDAPEGLSTCTRRIRSNTPLQALTLMNDRGFFEFAQGLEKIIQAEGLEIAFQRCTSRKPSSDEIALLEKLDTLNAARVLLNLDETVTRE